MGAIKRKRLMARGKFKALNSRRGYILLPVALGITLISALALVLNMESASDANAVGSELQSSQVQYVAEAGFSHAQWYAQNHACSGDFSLGTSLLGSGSYSAQLSAEANAVSYYSLPVVSDAYIHDDRPDHVHGDDMQIQVENGGDKDRRGLFLFDLSAISGSENIVEAKAWFYVTKVGSSDVLAIHAVTESWTEANASWDAVGNSVDLAPYAFISTPAEKDVWVSVNVTALAKYWLNVAATNYGLMVLAPDEGDEVRISAKESGLFFRPRLEITTADGPVSPLQITTIATLNGQSGGASNISRVLTQSDVTAYQSAVDYRVQPNAGIGKDTRIADWKSEFNYGETDELDVSYGAGNTSYGLLQFTVDIPPDADIVSAQLALYKSQNSSNGAVANLRRVSNDWEEGAKDGRKGGGATWLSRNSLELWNSPGADLDERVFDSSDPVPEGKGWVSWEVTTLVQGWVNGSYPNYGVAVVPGSPITDLTFTSSDEDTKEEQHPILTVTYRCQCGSPCLAPAGQGDILMIVDNANNLSNSDKLKKTQFESWGYGVTAINDSTSESAIAASASTSDVIYVSASASPAGLSDKLTDLTIGVVSEAGGLNSQLGFAASSGYEVSSTISISDNSHFISAMFPIGAVSLYNGAMEQQVATGSMAAGWQQLGNTDNQASLGILETGADLGGERTGEYAAGRRVLLPLGRDAQFNWNMLHGNGVILVQRAIEWAQRN